MALRAELVRAYRATLGGLLPTGIAWRRDQESNIQRLLRAYAIELTNFDERARALHAESDPRTALELLDEWEKYLGLPSECTGPLEDLAARRNSLVAKLTREPSASIAFFRSFAEALGYIVEVVEFRSFRMGAAGAGDRLTNVQAGFRMGSSGAGDRLENSTGWAHAWAIRSDGATSSFFRMGSSGAGDRLRAVGNELLECSIREIAPAHTQVLFFYFFSVTPSPGFLELGAPAATLS